MTIILVETGNSNLVQFAILSVVAAFATSMLCNVCSKQSFDQYRYVMLFRFSNYKTVTMESLLRDNLINEETVVDYKVPQKSPTTTYNCNLCSFKSVNKRTCKRHMSEKHGDTLFNCAKCSFTTRYKRSLNTHMNIHEKPEGMRKCKYCGYLTNKQSDMRSHQTTIHEKNEFKCDLCEYSSVRPDRIKLHKISKHGIQASEDVGVYKCDQCDYKTFRRNDIRRHNLVHYKREIKNNSCLKVDRKLLALFERPKVKCDLCDYETERPISLKHHKISKHKVADDEIVLFKCDSCYYVTYKKDNLQRHQSLHKTEKLKCEFCKYTTNWEHSMKLHKIGQHGFPDDKNSVLNCDQCDYRTCRKYNLKKHQEKHQKTKQ